MLEIIGMFTVTFIPIYIALGPLFRPKQVRLRIEDVNIQNTASVSFAENFITREVA